MTKRIEWVSEQRVLPTVGCVEKGSVIDVPDHMADGYISQGEAKEVKPIIKRDKVREGDDK